MTETYGKINLDHLSHTEAKRLLEQRYPGEEIRIEQSGDRAVYHAGDKLLDKKGGVVDTRHQNS